MAVQRKQPIDFRKEEAGYVMERWRASDSCSLVGVGSVGKSNLLQHLSDPDVQKYYMNVANVNDFKAITIDPSMLGPLPTDGENADQFRCWAGYELMMHRLYMAFYPFDMLERDDAQRFYDTYQTLQDGANPLYAYMGLRYFELGLSYFMRRGIQLVFMFDEFEDMLRNMPVKFFQTLRGLRDIYKRQLSYLTFTRSPLPILVDQYDIPVLDIEPFIELFTDNLYYVGPYNENDGRKMVENLVKRNQKNYDDYTLNFLLWATGRYAGLLRAGFRVLESLGPLDNSTIMRSGEQLAQQLAMKEPVRIECRTIWTSLSTPERYLLKAVAQRSSYTRNEEIIHTIGLLVQKRLMRVDKVSNQVWIEPPVFNAFVMTNPDTE
jgi:hypothetical protein